MNPYVFVVGNPRSGTTLLRRMLDAHPRMSIMSPETHWIPRYFKRRKGLTPEGLVTPKLIPKLLEYHRFRRLEIAPEELEGLIRSDEPLSYADFVSKIFDFYGERKGKPLVGDKTPGYVRDISLLHHLWPRARFVHIIRDGRDVCLSVSRWRMVERALGRFPSYEKYPLSTAALWWDQNVRLGLEAGRALPPGLYHEVRYEALVSHPKEEIEALCAFLGMPPDYAMLRFHEGKTRSDPGFSTNRSWLPPTPGVRDWRSQMPSEDLEQFEAAAGDLLDDLDYPRAFTQPSPEALECARKARRLFTDRPRQEAS
jgi:Sulfotransferase family